MPSAAPPAEKESRGKLRLLIGGFVLLNVLVFGRLAWFWYLSEPARQITVGPETTVLESPLKADGTVDFVAGLNERVSQGVTPENNAVALLARAYDPRVIADAVSSRYYDLLQIPVPPADRQCLVGESNFFTQRNPPGTPANPDAQQAFSEQRGTASSRPWTRSEFPEIAAMLDQNAAPLALVVEASRRERYYSPLLSSDPSNSMITILLSIEQEQREAARQLTARAMLKLGEGDPAGAWEDLLATHRLGRLTGQCPFMIGALVSIAIEAIACEADKALIASPALTAVQARQCLQDLQNLPPLPSIANQLDFAERLSLLDVTLQLARDPSQIASFSDSPVPSPGLSGAIDWNIALTLVNDEIDNAVAVMREPDVAKRAARLQEMNDSLHAHRGKSPAGMGVRSFLGNRTSASRDMGWSILTMFMPAAEQAINAETRAHAREQLFLTGFALAVYQRDSGAYPETLAALVPELLPTAPIDPWSGKELIYRRTETGFIAYSVWDDMRDNGGIDFSTQQGAPGDLVLEISGP
ncbi:MAG: hypothetical protein JNG89_19290 [Planctomycetaceae bacterium]|nr:hypothetical protein [Planctomycetaceae bacterium]